jgi:glycosyltransferase involved in cell wall biosynthesis
MGKRHSPEQIVRKLRQAEARLAAGSTVPEAARELGISEATYRKGGQATISEIIENEKSALLIDSRSADDLALAVMRLTDDLALRESMVDNARRRVQTLFSEARMMSEIDKIYQEVATL